MPKVCVHVHMTGDVITLHTVSSFYQSINWFIYKAARKLD